MDEQIRNTEVTLLHPVIDGLTNHWDFVPSQVPRWRTRQVAEILLWKSRRSPHFVRIRPVDERPEWTVYFLFAPDGKFLPVHRFTLARLKDAGHRLMVICATSHVGVVPAEVGQYADAVYWKALNGYDFSAYSLALWEIGRRSPHANVLVLNDSVFGPFTDLRTALANPPWDLTGYTASSQVENHIQSYAFILKDVTKTRMRSLSGIMFPWTALNDAKDVITVQETRFSRIAAKSMRVGAYWFGEHEKVIDPTLVRSAELIAAGFPFLKRSLLTKHQRFQDPGRIREILFSLGHPDL